MLISFGSVGDIVAVAQIAGKLCKALSASQGSAREFKNVVLELSVLHGALEQVGETLLRLILADGMHLVASPLAHTSKYREFDCSGRAGCERV